MKRPPQFSPTGHTLIETTIALAILAAAFVLVAQVLATCARQRRASDQLLLAQLEAANAAERIAALPYDQVVPDKLSELTLSNDAQAALPDGKLTATIEQSTDPVAQKRILTQVAWSAGEDRPQSFTLTTWRYDRPPIENP